MPGAHSELDKNFIANNIKAFNKYNVDCVGGVVKVLNSKENLVVYSIRAALSSFFGMGRAKHRLGSQKVEYIETASNACYKKNVFEKVGLFNESLIRSQDIEFNLRLKVAGGKILLVPDIKSYYYPKDNIKDFLIHNIKDGIWAIYPLKFVKKPLCLRHYIPLIFVLSLLGTGILGIFFFVFLWMFLFIISLYFLASLYFSIKIVIKEKNIVFLFLLPLIFATRHIGYGLGSILGIIKLIK